MPKAELKAVIALEFPDGKVGRMQFFDDPTDANIQAAIDKTIFPKDGPNGEKLLWPKGVGIKWKRVQMYDFPADKAAWHTEPKLKKG